ncbi:hypothetical protein [Streptomyces novaecaesareae]|uniref:phosphorylase family protein n=1 Tax=Streptomyces novaecaesareae TaxID=68244 RepID=UPI0031595508
MQAVGPVVGVDAEVVQAAGDDPERLAVEREVVAFDLEDGHGAGCSTLRVALAETGPGNRSAAVITEHARQLFDPEVLFFVGVAGALKDDIAIGDVVVATTVHAYHGGKDNVEGFLARPEGWPASHALWRTVCCMPTPAPSSGHALPPTQPPPPSPSCATFPGGRRRSTKPAVMSPVLLCRAFWPPTVPRSRRTSSRRSPVMTFSTPR